jgi:hypothetical protein
MANGEPGILADPPGIINSRSNNMVFKKNFPLIVAFYITTVGLFFTTVAFFEIPLIGLKSSRPQIMTIVSLVFVFMGLYFINRTLKGKLESEGESTTEIRKRAVDKIKTEAYLATLAKEDPDPEVRNVANERLKQLRS